MKRFVRLCVGSTAIALGLGIAPIAAAAGAAAHASTPGLRGGISTPRVVNLRAVSRETAQRHPVIATPLREANPGQIASRRAAAIRSGGRRSGLTALGPSRTGIQAASGGQTWSRFPAMNLSRQLALLGPDQGWQPPDTQLAAGPGALLEATNDNLSMWSKTGALLGLADLNLFFHVPAGQSFTDPRVLYDTQAGMWIVSGWSLDSTATFTSTFLAVSQTSDPFGNWNVYTIATSTGGIATDQPMTGVCDGMVVMSWNEYSGSGANFDGAAVFAVQKSALIAHDALTPLNDTSFLYNNRFSIAPAQSLGSSPTCWMTVNLADQLLVPVTITSPTLGVIALTGTPGTSTFQQTETDVPIQATNVPPSPRQPSGTTNDTALDDRFLGAVWQNNHLWTTATDACTPSGDTATRDCLRLDEVDTSGTPTLSLDTDLSQAGTDEYYPAAGPDSAGNLYVSFSASSPSLRPGAYAVVSASSSLGTFSAPVTIQSGQGSYDGGPNSRWGDYSAVALDPSVPGTAWATGEYAPSDAAQGDWATATAMVSLTAPPAPAIAAAVRGAGGVPYAQAPQLGSGWRSLGGTVAAPPAVVAAATPYATTPASPLFIATGTNKLLYMRGVTGGWQRVGPVTASCLGSPAAVITGGHLYVACEGTNRALYYNSTTVPTSGLPQFTSGWKNLGGVLTAGPAVAPINGVVTFFVRGTNGHIYLRTLSAGFAQQPWTCLGQPAAAQETSSRSTIFACEGTNHALYVSANGGLRWGPTVSMGGTLTAGPAIAATSRVAYLLGEGTTSAVYERTLTSGFISLGGIVFGGVGAAALN